MKYQLRLALTPLLCAAALTAQMGPAKEVKKLDHLVGTWETSGTAVMEPGTPEMKWTAKSSAEWVMAGNFVRELTRIDFGEGAPGSLQFITYFGWDRERQRYVACEVGNIGSVRRNDLYFLPDGRMVGYGQAVEDGVPTSERWVTTHEGDNVSFVGHRSVGGGESFVHVKGSGKRTSAEPSEIKFDDASFGVENNDKMAPFAKMAGKYAVTGSMNMPGMPKMDITGDENCKLIFGGTVFAIHTKGQPMDYEGASYIAWNPETNCYSSIIVSTMGESDTAAARFVDNNLVFTSAGSMQGQPMVGRNVLAIGEDGSITGAAADGMTSVSKPVRMFEASYKKKD